MRIWAGAGTRGRDVSVTSREERRPFGLLLRCRRSSFCRLDLGLDAIELGDRLLAIFADRDPLKRIDIYHESVGERGDAGLQRLGEDLVPPEIFARLLHPVSPRFLAALAPRLRRAACRRRRIGYGSRGRRRRGTRGAWSGRVRSCALHVLVAVDLRLGAFERPPARFFRPCDLGERRRRNFENRRRDGLLRRTRRTRENQQARHHEANRQPARNPMFHA